jgi:hypothetical protein
LLFIRTSSVDCSGRAPTDPSARLPRAYPPIRMIKEFAESPGSCFLAVKGHPGCE